MYDNQLVYLLDLCIFAYHLHSQTLIWPMDPYYEQMSTDWDAKKKGRRDHFMQQVHFNFTNQPPSVYHGPGSCQGKSSTGWETNPFLDPIIAEYERIYPWRPSFTRPNREKEPWILYNTPRQITERIDTVKMALYDTTNGPASRQPTVVVKQLHPNRPKNVGGPNPATDLLYCFEGGTGALGNSNSERQYSAWSLMGFILAVVTDTGKTAPYDIYIVFRGSRSGSLRAASITSGSGNPDWVTDGQAVTVKEFPEINAYGSACIGFAASMKSMLPTIMKCLEEIDLKKRYPPRSICVTGHSLGGALAGQFTSAVVLGNQYGYTGAATQMSKNLQKWPWCSIQLVTFSAPVVGGLNFQRAFDMSIGSRRVWLDGDPITQARRNYLVGQGYKIPRYDTDGKEKVTVVSLLSHEPYKIRRNLIQDLQKFNQPVNGVPANSGKEEDNEPWKTFQTCKALLMHIQEKCGVNNVGKCLPKFDKNFIFYFEQLVAIGGQYGLMKKDLDSLLTFLKNPGDLKTKYKEQADEWHNKLLGLRFEPQVGKEKPDANLQSFLELCFCLFVLSKNGAAKQDTDKLDAEMGFFDPILSKEL